MGALVAAVCCVTTVFGDSVERRGTGGTLHGTVQVIDDAGVSIRSDLGAVHVVSWDKVRTVDIAPRTDPTLEGYLEMGGDLWRARSRLERNDTALAEPLFERLFARLRGQTHETALVAAEGLLRCRLARGEQAAALVPALETIRLHRAGVLTNSYSGLRPVIDETLQLCPQLPPVWIRDRALVHAEHDLAGFDPRDDEVVAALTLLYRRSVARATGSDEAGTGAAVELPDHPGVELLDAVLRCLADDRSVREGGRRAAADARRDAPAWADAWTRYFVGVSLLGESGLGRQQQGLVSLAHVPARFGRRHWYLSGLALGRMAERLRTHRDAAGADTVRAELERTYGGHPVLKENP